MGIYATQHPGNVIVSPDKDMKQIPGSLFTLTETLQIDPQQGLEWHYLQTLAGDQTDGYSGVPGVGLKRAADLFEKNGYTWQTIVDAFAEKNLGEDVALMNARLAKILTKDEYDFTEQRPILWSPATTST
jgi:DNA polymerase-1